MKLIPGQMNVLLTICPVGYAEGAKRPIKPKVKSQVQPKTILRKKEYSNAS